MNISSLNGMQNNSAFINNKVTNSETTNYNVKQTINSEPLKQMVDAKTFLAGYYIVDKNEDKNSDIEYDFCDIDDENKFDEFGNIIIPEETSKSKEKAKESDILDEYYQYIDETTDENNQPMNVIQDEYVEPYNIPQYKQEEENSIPIEYYPPLFEAQNEFNSFDI